MANESQVPMAYNFNLPHGDDEDIEDSNGEECEADKDTIFNFEEGFSDDEAQPPFTRPTFQLAKNKKSPRCSDEDAEEESGVKKYVALRHIPTFCVGTLLTSYPTLESHECNNPYSAAGEKDHSVFPTTRMRLMTKGSPKLPQACAEECRA
jgi:hypothetical protein